MFNVRLYYLAEYCNLGVLLVINSLMLQTKQEDILSISFFSHLLLYISMYTCDYLTFEQ